MNPVDRAGPLTGTNFALSSYEKIRPGFRDEKRPKFLGTSFSAKLAYHGFGNSFSCITAV